jgi:hypothetical protein
MLPPMRLLLLLKLLQKQPTTAGFRTPPRHRHGIAPHPGCASLRWLERILHQVGGYLLTHSVANI